MAASGQSVTVLTDQALFEACGTRIAFTTRLGGVSKAPYTGLNLGSMVGDRLQDVMANRQLLMDALGLGAQASDVIAPKQVHGDVVLVADDLEQTRRLCDQGADGIVCMKPGVAVQLCFADCVPVIVVAPSGAFAVAHAGWRGAIAGIPEKAAVMLARESGCQVGECTAYVGPHIGRCCYEVSQELLDRFVEVFGQGCDAGQRHLDLTHAVTQSLLNAGLAPSNIVDADACTSCNVDTFYSYRAEDGQCGRHGAFAFIKE